MYDDEGSESVRLTNADFRKMLMTPRATPKEEPSTSLPDTVLKEQANVAQTPQINKQKSEQRKQRKQHYAKIKKEDDDKLALLALKYRDRAKERREGKQEDEVEESMRNTSAYRAVAPDSKSGLDAAERKKKMIHESKFLGGDMEHTHLVKGLDYALLQKVRSEIEEKVLEQHLTMQDKLVKAKAKEKKIVETEKPEEKKAVFRTAMARNLHEILELRKSKVVKKNELFSPGRMAYVVALDDEYETGEIPTTLIRSKADVPMIDNESTLSTNDIVINKLTQILSYLRQGIKSSKKSKKYKDGRLSPNLSASLNRPTKTESENIYDDIGDYIPTLTKTNPSQSSSGRNKSSYFGNSKGKEGSEEVELKDNQEDNKPRMPKVSDLAAIVDAKTETDRGLALASASNSYAECYPGLEDMNDTLYDSDEEVDYTKMDTGSKKGLLNRWDFDTAEEYSEYMGKREAMPKAAFQYGVKMEDGRRTQRSNNKAKNDKAKFEKQWQQIQNINSKRKSGTVPDGASKSKVPKNY